MKSFSTISIITLFVVLFFGSPSVKNLLALTISPARIEFSADPAQTIEGKFFLVNEQEGTQTFYSSVENFEAQGESGTPNFTAGKDGLATWVSLQSEVTLKKGEQKEIPFTIKVPKDAEAGGHFAAIFLSTTPIKAEEGQVSVGAKIGTPLEHLEILVLYLCK